MATRYVVLRRSSAKLFAFVSVQEANGPAQAVRLATDGQDVPEAGATELFVCVPERNWSIVPVAVRQRDPELVIAEGNAAGFLAELSRSDETGERAAPRDETERPRVLAGTDRDALPGPNPENEED